MQDENSQVAETPREPANSSVYLEELTEKFAGVQASPFA